MPSLKRNLLYNVSYQLLILIVPFITSPYVSRVLGPEGLGYYSVTTAIVKYFYLFALLGMANYGNRTIAKYKGDKETLSITFWNLFYFQLIVSSIALTVYVIYALTFGIATYGIVSMCQIPYILSAVFEISWFFYGMKDFKSIVLRNAGIKIITAVSVFLFVKEKSDVWIYVLINALSLLSGQICLWPFLRKHVVWKKPQWNLITSHFKPNIVLMVSVIAVSVYTLMDKIMIEWLANKIEVGYYENTEKIFSIATNITGAIGAVMLPRMSNLCSSDKGNQVLVYIEKSMKYILILAVALAFGISGVSDCFSVVYYGKSFERCGILISFISPAIIFYTWSNIIRNQFLLPNDMDNVFVTATITAAGGNFVLNGLLIPIYGALGAVIGTVGAQLLELCYMSVCVRKKLPLKRYIFGIFPFLGMGSLMYICVKQVERYLGISIFSLLLEIGVGSAVYISLVIIYLHVIKDEMLINLIDLIRRRCLKQISKWVEKLYKA